MKEAGELQGSSRGNKGQYGTWAEKGRRRITAVLTLLPEKRR